MCALGLAMGPIATRYPRRSCARCVPGGPPTRPRSAPGIASVGRIPRVGLRDHDEPPLPEDPITVRPSATLGSVPTTGPGLPLPTVEQDLDDAVPTTSVDQSLKKFRPIPRDDDESVHHVRIPHPAPQLRAYRPALTGAAGARRKTAGDRQDAGPQLGEPSRHVKPNSARIEHREPPRQFPAEVPTVFGGPQCARRILRWALRAIAMTLGAGRDRGGSGWTRWGVPFWRPEPHERRRDPSTLDARCRASAGAVPGLLARVAVRGRRRRVGRGTAASAATITEDAENTRAPARRVAVRRRRRGVRRVDQREPLGTELGCQGGGATPVSVTPLPRHRLAGPPPFPLPPIAEDDDLVRLAVRALEDPI